MRILITGNGSAGSWKIRGEQLGQALGATIAPNCTDAQIRAHDIVIVVKRLSLDLALRVRTLRKVLVWDVVDAWPQPAGNAWQRDAACRWIRHELDLLDPDGVVWPTKAMQADAKDDERPQLWLPHHARPGQAMNPLRRLVKVVAYEGRELYLGEWRERLEAECAARGWQFVVNPISLADADIAVAFRGGEWDGYAAKHWKSGVKLANAQATGTPFAGAHEAGYLEISTGGEYWAGSAKSLQMSLDWLTPHENRERAVERMVKRPNALAGIAETYRAWLQTLTLQ